MEKRIKKVAISYPPFESKKGVPLLSQNRQFQWFNNPTFIYPMIPAYAATLLKSKGYEVLWLDGIAEQLTHEQWEKKLLDFEPDLVMFETKSPVVKKHWRIINSLKEKRPEMMIALVGDHITGYPEESLLYSKVDFTLKGGDYDFGILNLADHLNGGQLDPGWYYRENGLWNQKKAFEKINWHDGGWEFAALANSGEKQSTHKNDLNSLPVLDRELTRWELYAYKNGNYRYLPGSYMMSGRDCWWGKCTFCSWIVLFPGKTFRTHTPERALMEVENCIRLGVKDIFEDSGTLPVGGWLKKFCEGMIEKGYNKKLIINCNMRLNTITHLDTLKLMKKAGFKWILFGLESVNQKTIDLLEKGVDVTKVEENLKLYKKAGLEPHLTTMVGYPWETYEEACNTINFCKKMFRKGYVDTLQATVVMPYPGTPLYEYCDKHGFLNFYDYDRYDQREQVMKNALTSEDVRRLNRMMYMSFVSPQFFFRKMASIRNFGDVQYYARSFGKLIGHLADFKVHQ